MTPNEYQEQAGRTLLEGMPELTPLEVGVVWNAIGLAGEAGELVDAIKKQIFHKQGLDVAKIKNESGDVLWYLSAICSKVGLTLEEVMEHNIEKLTARYPQGFDYARTTFREGVAN